MSEWGERREESIPTILAKAFLLPLSLFRSLIEPRIASPRVYIHIYTYLDLVMHLSLPPLIPFSSRMVKMVEVWREFFVQMVLHEDCRQRTLWTLLLTIIMHQSKHAMCSGIVFCLLDIYT